MKAMKSMNMNRMLGSLKRKPRDGNSEDGAPSPESQLDTPEANAARNVRLFCESGGPNGAGEEFLYLPTIVESAESSPSAAKECCTVIRKSLSKDNFDKPYIQYNAIMLIRILADNPGKTFTRNMDAKFVDAVKELLRVGRDPSVKQILMETLDTFQRDKPNDEDLAKLNEMWKKEHERMVKIHGPMAPRQANPQGAPSIPNSQDYFSRNHHTKRLPAPAELSSRIAEARTSAQLLSQTTQSTPPSEIFSNDLVREFADRCQSASRSIQAYMTAENPGPDNDTMETLIETNEMLSKAMVQHQRAVLRARKSMGLNSTPEPREDSVGRTDSGFAPPPGPPPSQTKQAQSSATPVTEAPTRKPLFGGREKAPQIPPPGESIPSFSPEDDEHVRDNPFRDPHEKGTTVKPPFPEDRPSAATGQFHDTLGIEPYHPGFQETQSYTGRQETSVGNVTMHAARDHLQDDDDDDDIPQRGGYGTDKGTEAPIYRY